MTTAVKIDLAASVIQGTERPEWLADATFPFESRYVEIEGNRIHYLDEGTGPTILFVHSNGV